MDYFTFCKMLSAVPYSGSFQGHEQKRIKASAFTRLCQRRACPMKGSGQGLKSFDCWLKRAICTQEEKGQPIPAPMNATGCQCQSWLLWANVTAVGREQRLRMPWLGSSSITCQDHKHWAVGYQLRLTVFLFQLLSHCQQEPTYYDEESFTICKSSIQKQPLCENESLKVLNEKKIWLAISPYSQIKRSVRSWFFSIFFFNLYIRIRGFLPGTPTSSHTPKTC